jgi:hypothetical protein
MSENFSGKKTKIFLHCSGKILAELQSRFNVWKPEEASSLMTLFQRRLTQPGNPLNKKIVKLLTRNSNDLESATSGQIREGRGKDFKQPKKVKVQIIEATDGDAGIIT